MVTKPMFWPHSCSLLTWLFFIHYRPIQIYLLFFSKTTSKSHIDFKMSTKLFFLYKNSHQLT